MNNTSYVLEIYFAHHIAAEKLISMTIIALFEIDVTM